MTKKIANKCDMIISNAVTSEVYRIFLSEKVMKS